MKAELYALTHRGNPGDVAFYRRVCRGAKSVLELGSGAGRLLAALASTRRRIVGLELDTELLALAKRNLRALPLAKRSSLRMIRADMRDFELEQRFERVLLPYNALYCLLGQRAALACFRAAHRALAPGGMLILDVWNAQPFHVGRAPRSFADDAEPIVSVRHLGRTWDVFERSRVRRAQQRLDVSYSYVPREGGSEYQISIAQRFFLPAEISDLLKQAGFSVVARYGDFSGTRFDARAPQLIVLARAA
ncbi:MAG TPA: class I SAM-dependent methyltransferase [Polyangiaceae bacterium]|nr:class I SAM-dependent methyltransferase [Polyangiaceae bacterium]